jgi:hypothetical protein
MTTTLKRATGLRRPRLRNVQRLRLALSLLAAVALLAPTLGLALDRDFAARSPSHGHLGSAEVLAHHDALGHHAAPDDAEGSRDLTFTPADDAGTATAVALPPTPAGLPDELGAREAGHVLDLVAAHSHRVRVPTPPPRA